MLMIRVNVPLQITRGIFVCGETIQMHMIPESNHTVIKEPRNGNSKKLTYHAQLMDGCT